MTAAYAFTDYQSQGQTIPYVLVDIATPPSGSLNLFNLYVALSHSSESLAEDDRSQELDMKTMEWCKKMDRRRLVE
ncbi:hypothetical protein BDN67DRAFT_910225 [Paxillus ammoniavirescens]|nr:hypothetical protein BDN67DRAFT_910225 [Paxillus ammoniavirescens]